MKTIKLTKGHVALVDDEDYDFLMQWKWSISHGYARRKTYINGRGSTQSMHREIMNPPKGMVVDHIDHDGLNNQKHNLRICTDTQNRWNVIPKGGSKYLGVSWHTQTWVKKRGTYTYQKWIASIRIEGKIRTIGMFDKEEDAAHAYDEVAKKYRGEFANLNFK